MSTTWRSEWEQLCLKALSETDLERRRAIALELLHFLHEDVYNFGSLRVDIGREKITREGRTVRLTNLEFKLLRHFIERPGTVLSREELLGAVWGYHRKAWTRTLDVHIRYLRRKLEQDPKRPELIVTVPGVGYKFLGFRPVLNPPLDTQNQDRAWSTDDKFFFRNEKETEAKS